VTLDPACENDAVTVLSARRAVGAVVSADFSDPTNERLIYLSAAGLFLIGVGLLVGTILWWRRGRQEHPALAPLEVLGSRGWTKAGEVERRRRLDKVRLGGATVVEEEPVRPEPVDLRELVRSLPAAFDDLRDPAPEAIPSVWAAAEPADRAVEPLRTFVAAPNGDVVADAPAPAAAVPEAPAPAAPAEPPVDPDATVAAPRPIDESAPVPGGNA